LWFKEGSLLDTKKYQDRFLLLPDGSLFFLNTQAKDSGSYHCTVLVNGKVYNSEPARLSVGRPEDHAFKTNVETPRVVMISILSESSATVEWSEVEDAEIYVIQIESSDSSEAIKNITVESDILKVKLHNLKASFEYNLSVAAKRNEKISKFSKPQTLKLTTVKFPSEERDIPAVLWVVSITVVVVMTVLTILGVTVVVIKIRSLKHGIIVEDSYRYDKPCFTSKGLSWIESPRTFQGKNGVPLMTFQRDHLMREHSTSDYDYATSDHYFLSSDVSSNSNSSKSDSNSSKNTSNHYACTNVNYDDMIKYDILN